MVMTSPLSYGLASYRRPATWAEAIVSTSCLSGYVLVARLPQLIANKHPVLPGPTRWWLQCQKLATTDRWPSYIGTPKVDLMRLFAILSNRHSANNSSGTWIKSSLSSYNGNCVEVAGLTGGRIRVRDSKHPGGAVLNFTPAEWDAFIGGVYKGEFDRPTGGR